MLHQIIKRIIPVVVCLLCALIATAADKRAFNIWEGTDCKAKVKLTPYLAEGTGNAACIVCPGGSYFWLDRKTEGEDVAEWLRDNGISAFVLEYRTGA